MLKNSRKRLQNPYRIRRYKGPFLCRKSKLPASQERDKDLTTMNMMLRRMGRAVAVAMLMMRWAMLLNHLDVLDLIIVFFPARTSGTATPSTLDSRLSHQSVFLVTA